jgi:hypothetical protein
MAPGIKCDKNVEVGSEVTTQETFQPNELGQNEMSTPHNCHS